MYFIFYITIYIIKKSKLVTIFNLINICIIFLIIFFILLIVLLTFFSKLIIY